MDVPISIFADDIWSQRFSRVENDFPPEWEKNVSKIELCLLWRRFSGTINVVVLFRYKFISTV